MPGLSLRAELAPRGCAGTMLSARGTCESVCRYTCAQLCPVGVREGLQFCRTDHTAEHYPLACCCSLWSSTASASLHNQEKITLLFFSKCWAQGMQSMSQSRNAALMTCVCLQFGCITCKHGRSLLSHGILSCDAFQRESPSSYAKAEIMPSSSKHNSNKAPLSYH